MEIVSDDPGALETAHHFGPDLVPAFRKYWVRDGGALMPEFVRPLGPQEAATLEKLLRSRTVPAGLYLRALIIHWSPQGQTPSQITARVEHKYDNVVKWIRRFNAEGFAGLQERPGRGPAPEGTGATAHPQVGREPGSPPHRAGLQPRVRRPGPLDPAPSGEAVCGPGARRRTVA